jgi:VWFA-related protein
MSEFVHAIAFARRPRRRVVAVALVAALAGAASLLAQEAASTPDPEAPVADPQVPPPTFPAEIEQVVVDVVVTDKDGNPVPGLTGNDMIVTEDKVPQTIASFEAVELPDEPSPLAPPPPRVSTNTSVEGRRGRTFVIVFDDMHMTPQRARNAKAAVASFLERGVREGDYVTLIASGGGAWWTSRMNAGREKLIDITKRLTGRYIPDISNERMSEWEAMQIHVHRDHQVAARVLRRYESYGVVMTAGQRDVGGPLTGTAEDPYVNARAADVYIQARTRSRITLESLERVLNGLSGAQGRKSVILVSEGFIYDPDLDGFKRVQEASRRANAAVYFVDAGGLKGMPVEFTAQFGPGLPTQDVGITFMQRFEAAAGAENLASDTGGFTVRNTNDLDRGIQRIARETRIYYLLGYIPTSRTFDGGFREIEVKLRNQRGLKVRARKGYYAPSAEGESPHLTESGADPLMQAAVDSPWAEDGIPLRMTAYVGGAEQMLGKVGTVVVTEVDIRGLEFEEVDGRDVAEIEFLLVVAHRESGEFFRYDQNVELKLRPSTREKLNRVWFPIARDFELQPGDHQAKMVIREARTGKVGSVIHEFEVSPLEGLRISSPILSDARRTGKPGEPVQPQMLARRDFPQGASLLCQFEVFGATKDDKGMPRVMQGYEVRRADGSLYTNVPESEIIPTSLGSLSRLMGFSLRRAAPGDYEIRMKVRDALSGQVLEVNEPFTVVPRYSSPPADDAAAGS